MSKQDKLDLYFEEVELYNEDELNAFSLKAYEIDYKLGLKVAALTRKYMSKKVDMQSVQIDSVHVKDYPKFVDAYVTYAEYTDGTQLTEDEMDELTSSGVASELARLKVLGA